MIKMEEELVFCQWIGISVKQEQLGEYCDEFIVDGKCTKCELSPQIKDLGAKPMDILRNISRKS